MKNYFTSDCHFSHGNIIKYCDRPFKDLDEMNNVLIKNWNERIKTEDTIFHIGDFCFRNSPGGKEGEGEINKAEFYRKQLNGNIIFIKGNHDCFSKEVRLLTKEGYKYYQELKEGDLIPTINYSKKRIEYNPIEKIVTPFIEKAYGFKSKNSEIEVSEDHKFWRFKYNQKRKNLSEFLIDTAKKLWAFKSFILLPNSFISGNKDYNISNDWIKLLAWVLTDGCIEKRRGYVTIYQSKENYIKELKKLFKKLNLKYNDYIRPKQNTNKTIFNKKIKTYKIPHEFKFLTKESKLIRNKLKLELIKKLPSWIYKLSDKQADLFINEIIKGDGTFGKKGNRVIWGTKDFLDNLLGFCVTHGISANLIKTGENYYLCIHKKRKSIFGLKQIYKNKRYVRDYNDVMWDVTVKNHNLFVEMNGKTLITSNSNNSLKTPIERIVIRYGGKKMCLVHNPVHADSKYEISLVGHVHNKWKIKRLSENSIMYNVGVDCNNFRPITWEEINKEISKWKRKEKKI